MAQDRQPLVVLKTSNGIVQARPGVGAITFQLFSGSFTVSSNSSLLTSDRLYYWFISFYFARMEDWTRIGKVLKLHLKIISFAKNEPSAMNENRHEGERFTE